MKSTARRLQLLAPAIGLVVGLSTFALPAVAGQLVTFSRGHSLVVQSAERRGDWYYLTLDGGGQIGVPAARVLRVEEYEAPPPPPAPVLAPPTYPVPGAAQATPPVGAPGGAGIPIPATTQPGPVAANDSDPLAAERRAVEEAPQDWRSPIDRRNGPQLRPMGGFSVMKPGAAGEGGRPPLGGQGGFRRPPGSGYPRPPQNPNNPPQQ